ncbi:putative response regulator [Bacillus sp. TS-2]|nr:putative response regulator [Bacillus sp. TS-2]
MYRLLIVDDEEIITDSLYDVFSSLLPDELDVCKAYSGIEAIEWMIRTRIDIVLTDIAMPGLNGLELINKIQDYWPRCKVIFLTGHNNFDYIYKAFQMNDVRYLLKTEGYDKVTETVKEVLDEIKKSHRDNLLIEQTKEQKYAYEMMAQGDFMRHLIHKSQSVCANRTLLRSEFEQLNISLEPNYPIYFVLGRLDYPKEKSYTQRSTILSSVRSIWERQLSMQVNHIGVVDRYGDILWFIQPQKKPITGQQDLIKYLEGTLELIQEECLDSIGVHLQFTISKEIENWKSISFHYDRLRQLQQLKMGTGFPGIMKEIEDTISSAKKSVNAKQKVDILTAHLEANRVEEFFEEFHEIRTAALNGEYHQMVESYYAVALVLYSYISHYGWYEKILHQDKLFRIDEHLSLNKGFQYLEQISYDLFQIKKTEERNRATRVIDNICEYIEKHLNEDLSLVRLAEVHYFNPSYLSYFFKQERGINISEYIDTCRITKAKELLMEGDLKVREVSIQVGYQSAHSFTRFFKKMTGFTPKEYRENLQQANSS